LFLGAFIEFWVVLTQKELTPILGESHEYP